MNDFIKGVFYGISYFSILSFNKNKLISSKNFYKGIIYSLPIVGFITALIISFLFILIDFIMPNWYVAIFVSILYLFLYKFTHLQGFASSIDNLYPNSSNDNDDNYDNYEKNIISSIVTFCLILLKVLAISYLLVNENFIAIILSLTLSRISIFFALDLEFHFQNTFLLNMKKSFQANTILKLLFLPINILSKQILKKLQKQIGFLDKNSIDFCIEILEVLLLNIAIIIIVN